VVKALQGKRLLRSARNDACFFASKAGSYWVYAPKAGRVRVFPARFVFLRDARDQAVGAMAIYATPEGSEQPFGPIVGL
jgi:hypothetical protein